MTKRFYTTSIVALIALFLPLALFATGEAEGAMTIPEGIDLVTPERIGNPNAEITLVWSPQQVYGPFSDIEARTSYLRGKLEEWTRAHPNVKIEPVIWGGDAATFYAKLAAEAASGRAPDAVQMPDLPIYNQWLQPIDEYIRDELDDFFPWTHEIMIDPADGTIKRIKFNTGTGGLWYRRDLVPEAPRSFDELIAAAKKLQADGMESPIGAVSAPIYHLIFPMWSSQGRSWYDDNEQPTFGNIPEDRQAMIDIFAVYRTLIDEGLMSLNVLELANNMDWATEMGRGTVAFFLGNMWTSQLEQAMSPEEVDNWALTHYPQMTADAPRSAAAGGWNYGFFSDDPEKLELAVDLVMHLYASADGMAGWCEAGGYPPSRASVYEYPAFQSRFYQELSAVLAEAKPWPSSSTMQIMWGEATNAYEAMLLGQLTPEEAVDAFWEGTLDQMK
jgi:multiple sugar transport system substrate-binding protein